MAVAQIDEMLGRTIGHYRITDHLGGGGMGIVYRAEDMKLGRTVALKFLPPELTRDAEAKLRFEREARSASLLDHPNICTIFDFGADGDGQMYMAMPCYDGESLAQKIDRSALPPDEAIRIIEQVARGLGKAHAAGIVHRDIKPANVMITADGIAKILDFGLAKLTLGSTITKSNTTLGTAAYMSPEQIRGEEVGPQTDIWALGIVLFELLTGRRPFRGEYPEALTYSILNEQPATLEGNPELDRIIKRMLRKDPLQRYQSVDDVLADLQPLKAPSSGTSARRRSASAEHHRLRSGARLGPYQIVKPIGSGGMGDIYLAKDTRLERQVAIKVLPPEFSEDPERKQRFKREAKTISQLTHPNICTLFDVGEQEGVDYLVMEYLEGETLAEKKLPLPIREVLKIGAQMADGLAAAHKQGIIHRDLKPANVMVTKSGTVKLLDFGLAKEVGAIAFNQRGSGEGLTAEGMIVGTLPYMALEQIEGEATDARTDIFALGAILYELATGKRAFEGETKASLIAAILMAQPRPMHELQPLTPPAFERVVRKCMGKNRDDRWQSAADVADELRWIAEAGSQTMTAIPAPRRRNLRQMLTIGAVVLPALAAAVIGTMYWSNASRKAPLVHLAIPLSSEDLYSSVAISPDGTQMVMGFQRKLWLRSFDSGQITPIAGTENAVAYPFWSPDGKFIAFFSENKLKKVAAGGGPVEVICDVKAGRGGSWGRDGTIVLAPDIFTPIHKVPENGGTPVPVTASAEKGQFTHRWPFFLPDGKHFLYTSVTRSSDGTDRSAVMAGSVDSAKGKLVVDHACYGFYVAPGWLIFAREDAASTLAAALMAVRFDPNTLEISGDPVALPVGKVLYDYTARWAPATASANGMLVYQPWTPPAKAQMYWVDREGNTLGSEEQPAVYTGAALSPDGRRIAFIRGAEDLHDRDLWLHEIGTLTSSRFTFGGLDFNGAPRWSADGTRLYYVAVKNLWEPTLVMKSLTGSVAQELHKGIALGYGGFDVSPDGRSVLIAEQFSGTGSDLMLVDVATRQATPFVRTSAKETSPAFSPDGKWVAYVGGGHVLVRRFPDTGEQWQIADLSMDLLGTATPQWSRDGRNIFYVSNGTLVTVAVKSGATFEAGTPQKLFPCDRFVGQSPDGKRFLVLTSDKSANTSLQVILNWTGMLESKGAG